MLTQVVLYAKHGWKLNSCKNKLALNHSHLFRRTGMMLRVDSVKCTAKQLLDEEV